VHVTSVKVFCCRFAYIEFADKDSVLTGQALDESLFRGRQIKVHSLQLLSPKLGGRLDASGSPVLATKMLRGRGLPK
jgi:hypothetical protein